jgi:uncharacterized membrane protein YeaQ/YmgE (transglycosylase-associated protein family)
MEHGPFWWIGVGLIAGILAKLLTPGTDREPKGCVMTIIFGIVGSLIVGVIMRYVLNMQGEGGFIPTVIGATVGAMLLIFAMRKFWK